jgi:hypothetical protein
MGASARQVPRAVKGIVREATFVPFGDIDAVRAALTPEYAR